MHSLLCDLLNSLYFIFAFSNVLHNSLKHKIAQRSINRRKAKSTVIYMYIRILLKSLSHLLAEQRYECGLIYSTPYLSSVPQGEFSKSHLISIHFSIKTALWLRHRAFSFKTPSSFSQREAPTIFYTVTSKNLPPRIWSMKFGSNHSQNWKSNHSCSQQERIWAFICPGLPGFWFYLSIYFVVFGTILNVYFFKFHMPVI